MDYSNTRKIFCLVVFIFVLSKPLYSQNAKDTLGFKYNSVYVELFGSSGVFYNLTYDRIFYKKNNLGISGAIGFQYLFPKNHDPFYGGSLQINFIFGHRNYFETGLGFAYLTGFSDISFLFGNPIRIGYRYQKVEGGLFFKIAFTPIILIGPGIIPSAGISAGYTF